MLVMLLNGGHDMGLFDKMKKKAQDTNLDDQVKEQMERMRQRNNNQK